MPNPLPRSASPNDPGVHVLLRPSAIRTAPHLDEQAGLEAYTQGVLMVPAPLAGLLARSVPIAVGEEGYGRPLGVSRVQQWGGKAVTLVVGSVIEDAEREVR